MSSPGPPLNKVPAVAAFLGVSTRTVYRLVSAGKLPAHRVGGQLRFDDREILAFTREQAS